MPDKPPDGRRRPRPRLDPNRPPRRQDIHVYLLPDLIKAIDEEADNGGTSRNAWIEAALMTAIYGEGGDET